MKQLVVVLSVLAATLACSPTTTSVKTYTQRDYSAAKHYYFESGPDVDVGVGAVNRIAVSELIRDGIIGQLDHKGLTESAPKEADIMIRYFAVIEDIAASETGSPAISDDPFATTSGGIRDTGTGLPGAAPPRLHDYNQGTLVIEAFDARTSKLLWRGTARSLVGATQDRDEIARRLDRTLEKLFRDFPPSRSGGAN